MLLNVDTGLSQQQVSDAAGNYEFFNVRIGTYSVTGELLSPEAHAQHLRDTLPQPEDVKLVNDIQAAEPKWIAPKLPAPVQ